MELHILFFIFASTSGRYTGYQSENFHISTNVSQNTSDKVKLTLNVDLPIAWFQYDKPLEVKSGGSFSLRTPMEAYQYQSYGKVDLRCLNIRYFVESTFSPNQMCFALYFLSNKGIQDFKDFQITTQKNQLNSSKPKSVRNISQSRHRPWSSEVFKPQASLSQESSKTVRHKNYKSKQNKFKGL
ncbi:unnamed protein product [Allacma fusca]|uniref:Uncharacterized protein n=1 Tax=Allacma fusca TaxID=39272 RepID=A0A8J2JUR1_9HEXA|nr:unnamed protein product [Allacma fusca]